MRNCWTIVKMFTAILLQDFSRLGGSGVNEPVNAVNKNKCMLLASLKVSKLSLFVVHNNVITLFQCHLSFLKKQDLF